MSKPIQAGDIVYINEHCDATNQTFGLADEMFDMRDRVLTVKRIDSTDEYIIEHPITGVEFAFASADLTTGATFTVTPSNTSHVFGINTTKFVQAITSGAKVYYPTHGGVTDGVFAGYLIRFPIGTGTIEPLYAVDENGKSFELLKSVSTYSESDALKFDIQPEELPITKYYTVAYKQDHTWETVVVSDDQLAKEKQHYDQYRILETWYE